MWKVEMRAIVRLLSPGKAHIPSPGSVMVCIVARAPITTLEFRTLYGKKKEKVSFQVGLLEADPNDGVPTAIVGGLKTPGFYTKDASALSAFLEDVLQEAFSALSDDKSLLWRTLTGTSRGRSLRGSVLLSATADQASYLLRGSRVGGAFLTESVSSSQCEKFGRRWFPHGAVCLSSTVERLANPGLRVLQSTAPTSDESPWAPWVQEDNRKQQREEEMGQYALSNQKKLAGGILEGSLGVTFFLVRRRYGPLPSSSFQRLAR